jgi:hypothetical protein
MIKAFNKVGIERNLLNIIKDIYERPKNILVKRLKISYSSWLKIWTRQGCLLSLLLFNIVLYVLGRRIRQEN